MNLAVLYQHLVNRNETEAINFLKTYKPSDLLFIRGQRGQYATV